MPLDHGCRLDQHHGIEDLRPNPVKPNPDKSIRREEPNPTGVPAPQYAHLMSKGNELKFKLGAATNTEREQRNEGGKNRDYARNGMAPARKSLGLLSPSEF